MSRVRTGERDGFAAPSRWLLLSIRPPPRGEELLLIDALRRLGARSVEREGKRYIARIPPPDDLDALLREAESIIRINTSLVDLELEWYWQPYGDWAVRWIREFEPRRVTDRIVVVAAGTEPVTREGDVVIRLEPGTAFGTAEHATTRACLRFLERRLEPGDRIADIGAGSGILAIAAALLGAGQVLALELDPCSCAVARRNSMANGVGDRVDVREIEVDRGGLRRLGRFDGVLANIESNVLVGLLPRIRIALAPEGWLIVSGILRSERHSVLEAALAGHLELREEELEEGWWTARLTCAP